MLTMTLIFEDQIAGLLPGRTSATGTAAGRYLSFKKEITEPTTPADLLGSLGIPPCETGRIVTSPDGPEISPDTLLVTDQTLVVDGAPARSLDDPRFLCDGHLGKLAMLLRILGFDTSRDDGWNEAGVARRGLNENRVVLSRSRSLLKRRTMTRAQLIRSDRPDDQTAEVLTRFQLTGRIRLFGRCSRCNGPLAPVPKDKVATRIPPRTALWLDTYYICRDCDHLFWEGTHVTALRERVQAILETVSNGER